MKVMRWMIAACIVAGAFAPTPAVAGKKETDRVILETRLDRTTARPGDTVTLTVIAEIKPNFHSYPLIQPDQGADTEVVKFRAPKFGQFVLVGDVTERTPNTRSVPKGGVSYIWVEGRAEWDLKFVVHPKAAAGKYTLPLERSTIPFCNDDNCVPESLPPIELTIDGPAHDVDDAYKAVVEKFPLEKPQPAAAPPKSIGPQPGNPPTSANVPQPSNTPVVQIAPPSEHGIVPPASSIEEHEANLKAVREQLEKFEKPTSRPAGGIWAFLGAAVFWGAVALITPCVFPMIPITVSFFLKQSESEHHRPIRMALIYCGTIILVLGIAALTLLTTFRALSVHWATNIALGGLFLVFALSLFGLYEITLPSGWVAFTSQREGRGGVPGTVFMALTFTIVSFTCVAPFLGGFGGMAGSGQFKTWELVLGAFAFSTTFASPFFVLALFPSLIKKLPQSGSWLNSVKVVMGFLELAAALKFFRTAELRLLPLPQYFTYDMVLGIWVALALICGLYLLNLYRLHHDEPIEHIGVVRMLLGLGFLTLAIYLAPAMFKQGKGETQRPGGVVYAWVDSFLLPEPSAEDLPWSVNLKGTIDAAREELARTGKKQFVFLDNTGVTCTNCKYNERSVFSRGDIHKLLLEYRLVQHYTDEVPEAFYIDKVDEDRRVDEAKFFNLPFQKQVFGTEQLPLYVIMEVLKDKVVVRGVYTEGKINDVKGFTEFLRNSRK